MSWTRLRRAAVLLRPRGRGGCTKDTLRCDFWNWGPAALRPDCCTEHLRELTAFVHELLDRHGIVHWLDFGTLLGAVREQAFIPWDSDVDFGVLEDDRDAILALEPEVAARGYVLHTPQPGVVRIEYSAVNAQHVDLFPWREEAGLLRSDFDADYEWPGLHDRSAFPPRYLEHLQPVRLYDLELPAPAPIHDFLVHHRYGADYMVPTRPVQVMEALPKLGPDETSPAVKELLRSIADREARLAERNYGSRLSRATAWRKWRDAGLPLSPPAERVARAQEAVPADARTEATDELAQLLASLDHAVDELEHPRPGDAVRRLGRRVRRLVDAAGARLRR